MQTMNETRPSVADLEAGAPGVPEGSARRLRELVADDVWLDELIDRADEQGVRLTGEGGFLPELIKARACQAFCVSAPSPFFEPPVCCLFFYRIAGPMSSLPGK